MFLSIYIFYTISLLGLYISAMGIEGKNIYPSLGRYSSSMIYGIIYIALPILLIFNVIKPVIKIFLGIVFLVITFYNFQFLYVKKIRDQNYSYQLPNFIYSIDQGKSICMNIRWFETNQIYNYGDYLSIRYYALMHKINISTRDMGVCDYYFINSMDDFNSEIFSTVRNLKLGSLYKIIDKDKKIYEYITILEK